MGLGKLAFSVHPFIAVATVLAFVFAALYVDLSCAFRVRYKIRYALDGLSESNQMASLTDLTSVYLYISLGLFLVHSFLPSYVRSPAAKYRS